LQITRKTLISLAGQDDSEPAGPSSPELPDHPAYQQILTAFADLRRPLRARDLCVALDLPIVAKNTENTLRRTSRIESSRPNSSWQAATTPRRSPTRTGNFSATRCEA
jgi:hypothetical protein